MELVFRAVDEPTPGEKWRALFKALWPAYKRWFLSEGLEVRPTYLVCRHRLAAYMPELVPIYERLCELAGGGDLAARFLSLYRPPAYISGCSQVAWTGHREPVLIRNYDYSPALCDGLILRSQWSGRRVVAMTDCLWGCLDGVNDAGLAVSLTFGGRRAVGDGFGIPLILRYVLEFCTTVSEATEVLCRVPTHMAYNVTLVDRSGTFRTVQVAPDRRAVVRRVAIATNHQGAVEWHDHARATATIEREQFLIFRLEDDAMTANKLIRSFLRSPLYTNAYRTGFGTLYTAAYRPCSGRAEYRWLNETWKLSLARFVEGERHIRFVSTVDSERAPNRVG